MICISLIMSDVEHLFMCLLASVCLLWRNVCIVLWPIFWSGHLFFWYWAAWAACIFLRLILCQLLISYCFSHTEDCLFTLLIVSFVVKKLLSLIRSICLFLLLFPLLLEVGHKGSCCDLCQRVFCLFLECFLPLEKFVCRSGSNS